MASDPRASRLHNGVPPAVHLVSIVRNWILSNGIQGVDIEFIQRIIYIARQTMDTPEIRLLWDMVHQIDEVDFDLAIIARLETAQTKEDRYVSFFYMFNLFDNFANDHIIQMCRSKDKDDWPPYLMHAYGKFIMRNGNLNGLRWIKRAAEAGDPDGIYDDVPLDFAAFERLAEDYGHIRSMGILGLQMGDVKWRARYYAYQYLLIESTNDDRYVIGREYEPFVRELWTNVDYSDSTILQCVDFYLDTQHAARQAALCSVFIFRPLYGRDITTLIGKKVYALRTNWDY